MDQKFKLGDMVRKINGSQWHGRVVGEYSTELTPEGYAVESATERGSVQIYPAAALELWDAAPVAPAGWQMVPVEPTQEMCAAAVEAGGEDGDHHEMLGRTWIAYRAMLAAAPAAPVAQEPVIGWAFHNPDVGWEWHADHPVKSGMAEDATGMRRMTLEQFRQRYGYADAAPPAAEQPDTVRVPRKLLAEAESIIESYAEALMASHAPSGDWEGEEAAHDDYEREAGVASKLRAILAGGAK